MENKESFEIRSEMASMHGFFRKKIEESMNDGNYFEASWLIYSCLENRFFRVLDKYKTNCKYCKKGSKCRKRSNQLAISTKVSCVERLLDAGVPCIKGSFSSDLLKDVRAWNKKRNRLVHDLLGLDKYEERFENGFKELATEGEAIVVRVYESCTVFRSLFFEDGYEFVFPEECMDGCPCSRNRKEIDNNA